MKGFIKVYDNLVPSFLQDKIESITKGESIPWTYLHNTVYGSNNDSYLPGFSKYIVDSNKEYIDKQFIWTYFPILYLLSNHLNFSIQQVFCKRLFLQLPTNISLTLDPHIDDNVPHWVCLYYINDSDGDTVFFNDNGDEVKKVSPKKGRIAFFDGSIKHSAGIPKIDSRFILNINFTANL
jgi:hypothetical protein